MTMYLLSSQVGFLIYSSFSEMNANISNRNVMFLWTNKLYSKQKQKNKVR